VALFLPRLLAQLTQSLGSHDATDDGPASAATFRRVYICQQLFRASNPHLPALKAAFMDDFRFFICTPGLLERLRGSRFAINANSAAALEQIIAALGISA